MENNNNIIEPPEQLYQEGNIIGKYLGPRKRAFNLNKKKKLKVKKENHKYEKNSLGNIIDVEV